MKGTLDPEQVTRTDSELYSPASVAGRDAPILIASDASASAALAMTTGRMLSTATELPVQVLSVIQPVSSLAPAPMLVGLPEGIDETRVEERLNDVREQRTAAGGDASWSIEVRLGETAPTIARVAKERSARLIVMGLNHHGTVDRVLGGDTVFDVVRLGETPVLVASEPLNRPPRVIVVGIDFSALSIRAAQLAVNTFPEATDVYLVHVAPTIDITIDGWHDLEYARVARDGFTEVVRSLDGCTARVHTVELTGRRDRELARFARGLKADMLVVGSYRRGLFRRLASGTVAARVLRSAPCPVLIVPEPAAVAAPVSVPDGGEHRATMDATLDSITKRNTGRRVVVEVDNPSIGAQSLAFDYCFLGIDYDHHTDRLQIYLGEIADGGARHLTHSVGAPRGVDVLRSLDGRDQVVRVADGSGQALITFW
ncbi:MAG TPA: universal stress protein [Gemmatimonadaceae bacterium]|nr:universal stress protein [Gemmatimonadaceae bacterium]